VCSRVFRVGGWRMVLTTGATALALHPSTPNPTPIPTDIFTRADEKECKVQCSANQISENLPVGWKAVVEGEQGKVVYITTDGKELGSLAQARSYLVPPGNTRTRCSTLPYTAVHCRKLQHTAAQCSTLQHTGEIWDVRIRHGARGG